MIPILGAIVSQLAGAGLQTVADAVQQKGKEYVEEKLGIELKPNMSTDDLAKVKERAMQHQEFMAELDFKNTDSARQMNTRIQESVNASKLSKNIAYYLDIGIVSGTFILAWLAFVKQVPTENKELVYMALGSLLTMTGQVINFHRGSSQGSKDKNEIMKGLK